MKLKQAGNWVLTALVAVFWLFCLWCLGGAGMGLGFGYGEPVFAWGFWLTLGIGGLFVAIAIVRNLEDSRKSKSPPIRVSRDNARDIASQDEARVIPPNVRQAVLDRDDYICRYCARRSQTMEVDHVIPVSQGGMSTLDNLVTACRRCNRKKAGRTPEEAGMTVLPVRTQRRNWE